MPGDELTIALPATSKTTVSTTLPLIQALDGVHFVLLVAAWLTLVFGIINFINLAHGVQYMVGASHAATFSMLAGSFPLGLVGASPAALAVGLALAWLVFRHLYDRSHLDRLLATLKREGQSILVIDKNVDGLATFADRHVVVEKGRVSRSGTTQVLRADATVEDRFLHV